MVEVIFTYNGIDTFIQSKIDDNFKDICRNFCTKLKMDINKLAFISGGDILNLESKINQKMDKIKVLVYDKNNSTVIDNYDKIVKSKDLICPKCGELCLLNFNGYKIILNNCKNKHEEIIPLKKFDEKQNINESKIVCNICNNKNKGNSYDNKFYICGTCSKNICLLCKEKHDDKHIIIDYDNKNYLCHRHNESFVSYCDICNENLCMQCELDHNINHKIISYKEIIPNMNDIHKKNKRIERYNGQI